MNRTDLVYRRSAAEGASGFGLLIALFDTLAGDLRRAAQAQRDNDIQARCREANHAILVIGHLEQWVLDGPGGELSAQLLRFYSNLRRKLIAAQIAQSAEVLEQHMADVLKLREYWQEMDLSSQSLRPGTPQAVSAMQVGYPPMQVEGTHRGWSF